MGQDSQGPPQMQLDVRVLVEVDHVFKHFAADDDLALGGSGRVAFSLLLDLEVHSAHIGPNLEVVEDFDELHKLV